MFTIDTFWPSIGRTNGFTYISSHKLQLPFQKKPVRGMNQSSKSKRLCC